MVQFGKANLTINGSFDRVGGGDLQGLVTCYLSRPVGGGDLHRLVTGCLSLLVGGVAIQGIATFCLCRLVGDGEPRETTGYDFAARRLVDGHEIARDHALVGLPRWILVPDQF